MILIVMYIKLSVHCVGKSERREADDYMGEVLPYERGVVWHGTDTCVFIPFVIIEIYQLSV